MLITSVKNDKGVLITDSGEINASFRTFYQTLYTSQCTKAKEDIDNFLSQMHLPSVSEAIQKEIGGDITLGEIQQSIKNLTSGKSLGGNGFPI